MRVLVVGGAGYIGSHSVHLLREQAHDVRIFDNLSGGYRSLVPGIELVHGDILDRAEIDRALKGMDAVLHFAAKINVGESVHQPRDYLKITSAAL